MCSSFHCETWKFLISIPWYYWTLKNSSRTKTNPYFDPITLDFSCFSSNLTLLFISQSYTKYYITFLTSNNEWTSSKFLRFFLNYTCFSNIFFFFEFVIYKLRTSNFQKFSSIETWNFYLLPALRSNSSIQLNLFLRSFRLGFLTSSSRHEPLFFGFRSNLDRHPVFSPLQPTLHRGKTNGLN